MVDQFSTLVQSKKITGEIPGTPRIVPSHGLDDLTIVTHRVATEALAEMANVESDAVRLQFCWFFLVRWS